MRDDLEKQLCEIDPVFMQEYIKCQKGEASEMTTCMYWGVSTGDGWFNVIRMLFEEISQLNQVAASNNYQIVAKQIKEKFGGLRVYFSVDPIDPKLPVIPSVKDYLYRIVNNCIRAAEDRAFHTCEFCGKEEDYKESLITTNGYISRICAKCYDEKHPIEVNDFTERWHLLDMMQKSGINYKTRFFSSIWKAYASLTFPPAYEDVINSIENPYTFYYLDKIIDVAYPNLDLMEDLVRTRIKYHKQEKDQLLQTKDSDITYGNRHHDNFWGVCSCEKCKKEANAHNYYGKILMKIREELKKEKGELK